MIHSIETVHGAIIRSINDAWSTLSSVPAKDMRVALARIAWLEGQAVRIAYLYGATR